MRSTLLRFTVLVAALASGATAGAFPSATNIKASFQQLDTDNSEQISVLEWELASYSFFKDLDKNNDGDLDRSEIQMDRTTFDRLDSDGDGMLSLSEYMALRYAIFHAADIDSTDHLNFVEYEILRLLGAAGWGDTNKTNRIEIPELRVSLRKVFALADLNGDGQLSASEAAFMQPEDFAALAGNSSTIGVETFIVGYKRKLAGR